MTTIGGGAGYGKNLTYGGGNHNAAIGFGSQADQQVVTLGGSAMGRGKSFVSGGQNRNAALGFGSSASQQVFTGAQ